MYFKKNICFTRKLNFAKMSMPDELTLVCCAMPQYLRLNENPCLWLSACFILSSLNEMAGSSKETSVPRVCTLSNTCTGPGSGSSSWIPEVGEGHDVSLLPDSGTVMGFAKLNSSSIISRCFDTQQNPTIRDLWAQGQSFFFCHSHTPAADPSLQGMVQGSWWHWISGCPTCNFCRICFQRPRFSPLGLWQTLQAVGESEKPRCKSIKQKGKKDASYLSPCAHVSWLGCKMLPNAESADNFLLLFKLPSINQYAAAQKI